MTVELMHGDCIDQMRLLPDNSIDAIVTDPPYALTSGKKGGMGVASVNLDSPYGRSRISTGNGSGGFMGKQWDAPGGGTPLGFQAWCQEWATEALRVLKPGGHIAAFGGTRTYHRLTCGLEDAGFEIRDCLQWLYGSGFPKSHDVSKAIDKASGAERETVDIIPDRWTNASSVYNFATDRPQETVAVKGGPITAEAQQWDGWGTALKPANEPIVLARKPLAGTVAANVLQYGTGALNIDGCRIGTGSGGTREGEDSAERRYTKHGSTNFAASPGPRGGDAKGRWPANVILDETSAELLDEQSGPRGAAAKASGPTLTDGYVPPHAFGARKGVGDTPFYGDSGGASRFYYVAKASRSERGEGNTHPTVKPLALMQWLVRLITPPNGTVLDPFAGSGTTLLAVAAEGFSGIGIERESDYCKIIAERLEQAEVAA